MFLSFLIFFSGRILLYCTENISQSIKKKKRRKRIDMNKTDIRFYFLGKIITSIRYLVTQTCILSVTVSEFVCNIEKP